MLSSKNLFYYCPNDDSNNNSNALSQQQQQQQQQQERRIVQFVFVVQRQIIGILLQFLSLLFASSCLLKLKDDKTRKEGINIISNDNNIEQKDEDEESSTGTTISTTTTSSSSTDYDDDDIDIDENSSNNNEEQEVGDNEYYMKEYNDSRCSFPHEEIQSLQNRHDKLENSSSLSSAAVGLLSTTTIENEIPSSLSYDANLLLLLKIQKIQLMGIFPTSRWLYDPTMPPDIKEMFGGTPFFPLGEYRVANIDLLSTTTTKGKNDMHHCATTRKKELVIIVNTGVEGMDIGYYGGCFERDEPNKCYAKFDHSKVKIVTSLATTKQEEESRIRRINHQQQLQSRDTTDDADASTQLRTSVEQSLCQRLLDDTVKVLLDLDWTTSGKTASIPKSMIEICDTSPRIERQRQRRISAELTTTRRRLLLSSSSSPPTETTQQPKVRSSYSTSKRFLFAD